MHWIMKQQLIFSLFHGTRINTVYFCVWNCLTRVKAMNSGVLRVVWPTVWVKKKLENGVETLKETAQMCKMKSGEAGRILRYSETLIWR